MLPNVPQFGVPWRCCAGYTCVNVNPLYRPRAGALKDSGATAIVIPELCPHPERNRRSHGRAACGDGIHGRPAGHFMAGDHLCRAPPGQDGACLRAAPVPWPQGRQLQSWRWASRTLAPSQATLDSIAFLQYTGGTTGHPRVWCSPTAALWPPRCRPRPGSPRLWPRWRPQPRQQHCRAAAVPHLSRSRCACWPSAAPAHADSQPARLRQVHRGAQETPLPHAAGGQHPVQRAAAAPAVQDRGLLAPVRVAGRGHGRQRRHGQAMAKGHRQHHD